MRLSVIIAALLSIPLAACAAESVDPADGSWVGTITTEGNVTTVVNESGSVWGGTATLVEEASIGVDAGPEEYMLGEIAPYSLYATDDEIYLVDASVSKVRVYDLDGNHLRSFGRRGQGPGELGHFLWGILVGSDGRIYVGDPNNQRINIYSRAGETAGELSLPPSTVLGMAPLVFAEGGGIWLHVRIPSEDGSSVRDGFQIHTPQGPTGQPLFVPEIEYERLFMRVQGRDVERVPFAPDAVWTFGYEQALIAGASRRYAFRIIHPSGKTTLVERFWDPVPVTAEEASYWRRYTVARYGGETDWNGDNIPDHKPAFMQLLPAISGEVWVWRQGGSGLGVCDLGPEEAGTSGFGQDRQDLIACLYPELFFDVFDRDGRYLGRVEGLQLTNTPPFFSGDTVIAGIENEAGTIMVKRYRLVQPREQQ